MDAGLVEGRLTSLDSYRIWHSASLKQQKAFDIVPFEIDQRDPKQLRQQLGYLATEEAQRTARQTLMQEVVTQDDGFLPITYRLGALAAFEATDKPLTTKHYAGGWSTSRGSEMFRIDRSEQQLWPSEDPVKLTVQVGDELERIKGILDVRRRVPVVMVWNHNFNPPRLDYDEVVVGELTNPRESFQLETPRIAEVDGQKVIQYVIPSRLHGVNKGEVIRPDEYVQPEEKYKNPVITTLVKLGVAKSSFTGHDPDALYIGSEEVKKRIAKAKEDNEAYARAIERRSHIPRHMRLMG